MTETATRNGPLANKTVTDLLVTAEAVIRSQGRWDYVYKKGPDGACRYRDGRGAPDCLIGHVLYRWGVLDLVEEGGAGLSLSFLGASTGVADVAQVIQAAQDEGETWSFALGAGHHYADRLEAAA